MEGVKSRLTKRRTLLRFMGALGAGLAVPGFSYAQAAKKTPTMAVLYAGDSEDDKPVAQPFFDKMARLATGREPTLIYATTTSLAAAVLKETNAVPVVFATVSDPVAAGLAASLAKPGRNATGAYLVPGDASARRFQLVREALPAVKRLGAVFDRSSQDYQSRRASHEKSARAAGLELVGVEFTNFEAIARIFAQFKRDNLLAAGIADRILKGAKAAEIPVERVQKFELAINNRVAEKLALHIPKTVLQRADRVFN